MKQRKAYNNQGVGSPHKIITKFANQFGYNKMKFKGKAKPDYIKIIYNATESNRRKH